MALLRLVLITLILAIIVQLIICTIFGFTTKKTSFWDGFLEGFSWLSALEDDTDDEDEL